MASSIARALVAVLALAALSVAGCAGDSAPSVDVADLPFGETAPPVDVTETSAELRFETICRRAGERRVVWLRYRRVHASRWTETIRSPQTCRTPGSRAISAHVTGLAAETDYRYELCAEPHRVWARGELIEVGAEDALCVDSTTFTTERPCDTRVSGETAARTAVEGARPGEVVCLAPGGYSLVDLADIDKPIDDPVTFRGFPDYATSVIQIAFGGSSGLVIERLRARQIEATNQEPTDHITIRLNDLGGTRTDPTEYSVIHSIGASEGSGQHSITIERNHIHDAQSRERETYGIEAQGNAPRWTVRYNRLERLGGDYLQTGNPSDWLVDHNWFLGPSKRTIEDFHPDLWQSLDPNAPGTSITFSNNRVHETDVDAEPGGFGGVTTGFIFQDIGAPSGGYHAIRIENNLLNRIAEGDACQLTNSDGLIFRNNTVRAGTNGWRCRHDSDVSDPPAVAYTVTRNVFTNSESTEDFSPSQPHLDCNAPSACDAVSAGSAENVTDEPSGVEGLYGSGSVRDWTPRWSADGWYRAQGLSFPAGHNLTPADFAGWPFD